VDPLQEGADGDLAGCAAAEGSDETGLGGSGGGGGVAAGLRLHERREEGKGSGDPPVVLAQDWGGDGGGHGGSVGGFRWIAGRVWNLRSCDWICWSESERERGERDRTRGV